MKTITLAAALLFSMNAFAQRPADSTSSAKAPEAPRKAGFTVAAVYTNLTDVAIKVKVESPFGSASNEQNGSTHLGMSGIRIAYTQNTPNPLFSIDPGFTFQQRMNKSEAENEVKAYTLDGNLVVHSNRGINGFFGLSLTQFDTGSTSDRGTTISYLPAFGAQAGVGFQKSNFSLKLGYASYGIHTRFDTGLATVDMTGLISGFNAQVGYIF